MFHIYLFSILIQCQYKINRFLLLEWINENIQGNEIDISGPEIQGSTLAEIPLEVLVALGHQGDGRR